MSYVADYNDRIVAFDSNILTYFLDANRGNCRLTPGDPIEDQRIAAMRLFLYCRPFIMPTVKAEAERIRNQARFQEHIDFIGCQFGESIPDENQDISITRRAAQLLPYHPNGQNDCRILAEVEEDGGIPVLVTWDSNFRGHLAPHTRIRLESPVQWWQAFNIPRGTPPVWKPAEGHPLANETWWRWD